MVSKYSFKLRVLLYMSFDKNDYSISSHKLYICRMPWRNHISFCKLLSILTIKLINVFELYRYDFDNDGLISREDVQMVLYYVPMIKNQNYESNDY